MKQKKSAGSWAQTEGRGRFRTACAQRGHGANYYVVHHGSTPENHPPTEACMINSKGHGVQNSGPWDPWQASDEKKKFLVHQQGL